MGEVGELVEVAGEVVGEVGELVDVENPVGKAVGLAASGAVGEAL